MKKIITLLTAVALLLTAHPVTASVTLNLDVENLYGPTAGVPAAPGSTVVLIGSTQNATFGDLTQATNSFTAEADDVVLGVFNLGDGGVFQNAAFLDIDTSTAPASGLSLNDPLLLVWYPNLTYAPTLTGPGNAQLFGTYRSANATFLSDIGWSVPANGTYTLAAFAVSIGGDVPDANFTATQTTAGAALNTPPIAVCQDVVVVAGASCQASVTAAQVDNSSSDPDGDPITLTLSPAGPFALGTNNVTLTVADNKGGTNTCVAKVIVRDTTLPTITCPSNISTQLAPGQVSIALNFPAPTTGDNCGVASVTSLPVSGSVFPVGSTIVTNRVVDNSGNTNLCTFTVTVNSAANRAPLAICQDVTVSAGATCQASVTAAQVNNGSSDPDSDPISLSLSPVGPFALGTNNVTLTVADNRGGTNTCVAKVIVRDSTLPTITCPSNISTQLAPGQVSIALNFPAPTSGDNCGVASVTSLPVSGSSFPVGSTIVTNRVVDNSGNTNLCTFTVTVNSAANRAPLAICQDVAVSAGATCQASVTAAQVNNGSNDPDGDPITLGLAPTGPFALGTNNVTLTVADNRGGTNTCVAKVIVRDTTLPTITCPSNISTQLAPGQVSAVVNFPAPTTGDNCGVASVISLPVSGSVFPVGSTIVTNRVVDNSGNTNLCAFTVTVNAPGNQAPLAVCQDVTVFAAANCLASVTAAQVNNGSSDPDGDPITLGLSPAGPFGLGTNNVTLTVADNKGGTNTCVAKVIVRDNILPAIACPADVTVNVPGSQTSAVVTFAAPQASDACGLQSVSSSPASGSTFPLGSTTVTSTAVDNAGNLNTCTFTVTVTQTENQTPVALCRDVTVTAGANCTAPVTAAQVDNGSNDPDGTIASRTLSPAGPYALGQTLVTLTVVDNLGATNTCTATITVEDKTAPTLNCPANIVAQANSNDTTAVVTFTLPAAVDNCGSVTVSAVPASGSAFALGVTPVLVTAVDNAGNTNTCTFTVTVTAGQTGDCNSIAALIEKVNQLELTKWRKTTLLRHLQLVQRHQQAGRLRAAQAHMEIFVRSVRWLDRFNLISPATADDLIECAQQIIPFRDGKYWNWED